jgi:hypothetical protein
MPSSLASAAEVGCEIGVSVTGTDYLGREAEVLVFLWLELVFFQKM